MYPDTLPTQRDLGTTVTILVPALFATQSTLTSMRTCVAMSLLTRTQTVEFLKASANLRSNELGCFTVLKACVRYGETVMTGCAASLRMRPYARVADVGEMKERAREIVDSRAVEAVSAMKMGGKAYQRALSQAIAVARKVDSTWHSLLARRGTAFADLLEANTPHTGLSRTQLGRLLRSWTRERAALGAGLQRVSMLVVDC
ncbi:hypothetical protein FA95DRAFT_1201440 [Auriscalpium vulgare]|uniref:Uncharacterized protein n=1 Tax=Auriscalpium vulgare TaxID=40419 RepID=A0ACB8R4V0_9AGAM|nr:hypothetical protein FA95DRAFT_1201440 [Auriscalpium vulgare]